MFNKSPHHATGVRTRTLVTAMALTASLGVLTVASPALAKAPTGEFAVFSHCPRFVTGVELCVFSQTTSGEVTLGKQTVPINKTITLQGGLKSGSEELVPAEGAETLSKTPLAVPGGLAGLVKCYEISNFVERVACELVFQNGVTGVNATTELVGTPLVNAFNVAFQEGTGVTLPVRVHLENPFLGGACYIGSAANPITFKLTTGTTNPPPPNKPISGAVGAFELKEEGALAILTGVSLVDNAFAAPKAKGCGGLFSLVIDPLVNAKIGLPSAAGTNTAILSGTTVKQAAAEDVIKSEK